MKKETDKLEQFINSNQSEFDSEFKPENGWRKLETKISTKNRNSQSIWMMAASIAILLSLAWMLYDRAQLTDKIYELENLSVNNKPYTEIENFYQQDIYEKTVLVNQMSVKTNIKIDTDLKSLNKKYADLKTKVKEQGGHPKLINAMIQNLQTQINILEQQLRILQDLQEFTHTKNQENEISI
ncbi:hypothetical protein SAMN05661096_02439 [Marivirga sericea]|uniref:Anti-sigma factor n=1 Tax=Marivirga sericea TaxID=1028 RepID=A0A1X7K956_9BACT|nr:hypothetical protein [Marivirga sericea]SMG37326.1 hypothetical protein SAMN05661096_02439 [Marivirga sericea]